ncbi:MAG TPA: ATP-dependent DNA helicase RecG [Kofleriaceae bacterium]|nr:ATP-dependent DNA helicase RecG [Kofleriaceae bacterium]
MNAELKRRVDALRRPLELAAADGFAGVRKVQGLGHALRVACDGVIAQLPDSEAFTQWRAILARWEQLDENAQAIEVARGMRLLARFPRASRPAPVSRTSSPGLGARPVPTSPTPTPTATPTPITTPPTSSARPRGRGAARRSDAPAGSEPVPRRPRVPAEPAEPADVLAAPTHTLPGIGPAFAERLAEKGLVTVEDLLWMVPRRYDDVRDAKSLAEACALPEGTRVTFVAKVASARMVFARGRRWAEVRLGAIDLTAPATALVRWFNVFAIDKRMPAGSQVALSGVVRKRGGHTELANPDILGIEIEGETSKRAPAILARYPDVAGVPPARLRSACAAACARVGAAVDDGVPTSIERAAAMPSLGEALARLHAPPPDIAPEELAAMNRGDSAWQRRLAFGELFALGVAITQRRRARRHDAAVPCPHARGLDAELARALPFALTGAQRRTIDELWADLSRDVPMNRLLQGDVGAGKTAVAFAAALAVTRAGRQTAVMAPTELLAEQHMETWRAWAQVTRLRVELLTASTPKGVRQSLLALLAAGEVDVVIGTHALLAESVGFAALGLVVIDEQHRFGVAQRARLRDKGDGQGAPHLLVMTATPIPRTLALTAFGDLDASVLDELPPGRQPVATRRLAGARGRSDAVRVIAERVAAGERAYVVCPKVEPTDDADVEGSRAWADATTTADELARALPSARVGLVHGRLDSAARDRVMRAFKTGELDVLVATTVIEVGVDVPAATVIAIHDAERFGLAQLHQLRGRVGRGGGAAQCLLLSGTDLGPDAEQRLTAMVETHDGFQIAEYDLALRGPGELMGPRQAGVPRLRFGDLGQHTALLLEARRHAEQLLGEDPDLDFPGHAALRRAIDRRFARDVYGAESG